MYGFATVKWVKALTWFCLHIVSRKRAATTKREATKRWKRRGKMRHRRNVK
jgi:hypothetical protein